jgi:hypothetical protein
VRGIRPTALGGQAELAEDQAELAEDQAEHNKPGLMPTAYVKTPFPLVREFNFQVTNYRNSRPRFPRQTRRKHLRWVIFGYGPEKADCKTDATGKNMNR